MRIFLRVVAVLLFLFVGLFLWIVAMNAVRDYRLRKLEEGIRKIATPGQKYSVYRDRLYKECDFAWVQKWEEGEPDPDGRSIRGISKRIQSIAVLVDAEFNDGQELQSFTMRRRGHTF